MDIELLVVRDCPHEAPAATQLRTALDDIGLAGTPFTTTVIETLAQAERRGFVGSPTILINGDDPFAEPGQQTAVACRIYRTTSGPAGIPDPLQLRQALKRAAASNLHSSDAA